MGIYVKDMITPKDCRECPFQVYHSGTGRTWCYPADKLLAKDYMPIPFDGIPVWCPLVEIPTPHGRLIDADYLMEHLYTCETNGRPLHIMELDERLACIDEVPTVIEAEGE